MMRLRSDPIVDFLRYFARYATPAEVQQMQLELRALYGGREHYIKKAHEPISKKTTPARSV